MVLSLEPLSDDFLTSPSWARKSGDTAVCTLAHGWRAAKTSLKNFSTDFWYNYHVVVGTCAVLCAVQYFLFCKYANPLTSLWEQTKQLSGDALMGTCILQPNK